MQEKNRRLYRNISGWRRGQRPAPSAIFRDGGEVRDLRRARTRNSPPLRGRLANVEAQVANVTLWTKTNGWPPAWSMNDQSCVPMPMGLLRAYWTHKASR